MTICEEKKYFLRCHLSVAHIYICGNKTRKGFFSCQSPLVVPFTLTLIYQSMHRMCVCTQNSANGTKHTGTNCNQALKHVQTCTHTSSLVCIVTIPGMFAAHTTWWPITQCCCSVTHTQMCTDDSRPTKTPTHNISSQTKH